MAKIMNNAVLTRVIERQRKRLRKLVIQFAILKNMKNIELCEPCIRHICNECLAFIYDFDLENFEHKMIHENRSLCTACETLTCDPCKLELFLAQHSFSYTEFNFVESNGPQF